MEGNHRQNVRRRVLLFLVTNSSHGWPDSLLTLHGTSDKSVSLRRPCGTERLTGATVTGEHPVVVRLEMGFKISLPRLSRQQQIKVQVVVTSWGTQLASTRPEPSPPTFYQCFPQDSHQVSIVVSPTPTLFLCLQLLSQFMTFSNIYMPFFGDGGQRQAAQHRDLGTIWEKVPPLRHAGRNI